MSPRTSRGPQRLLRAGRSPNGRPPQRPSAHAIAVWMLFAVYVFAAACAVWDIVQPATEAGSHRAVAASAAAR